MKEELQNSISTNQLCKEYNWYQNTFPKIVQESCNEFFNPNFRMELIGISKNINCLLGDESCFVTKIKIGKDYEMFFRLTSKTIDLILSKILGQSKMKFNINKISELEAKIITSFNDYLFEHLKGLLSPPPQNELKRNNFDVIHLTFIIKETEEYNNKTGKVFITMPAVLLNPEVVVSQQDKFSEEDFPNTETMAQVFVGKTKFSLFDIKNLENDDVVVFEDSNIENLQLAVNGKAFQVKLNPNMDILIPAEEDGGEEMSSNTPNIWDSLEVEMTAEFDAVKISLGELKSIENGNAIMLNNMTLFVVIAVFSMLTGTMLLMWIGEQITQRGVGNGISLIIFAGIVSGIPQAIGLEFKAVSENEKNIFQLLLVFAVILITVFIIIYVELGERKN